MPEQYGDMKFDEAIAFFRDKINLPSEKWSDIIAEMHNRGFTVAGVTKAEQLADFRAAVDAAITDGKTLQEFQKDFDSIVEKHGWDFVGGRIWRAAVIYDNNVTAAHAAGRRQQQRDPDVMRQRPYWRYRHSDVSENPREKHLGWDGLVLAADDPWWDTHYPPNGWGCKCFVETLSKRDLEKMNKTGPDAAPETQYREWKNPSTGETETVPEGIDPGWDHAPGEKKYTPNLDKYPPELREQVEAELDEI